MFACSMNVLYLQIDLGSVDHKSKIPAKDNTSTVPVMYTSPGILIRCPLKSGFTVAKHCLLLMHSKNSFTCNYLLAVIVILQVNK